MQSTVFGACFFRRFVAAVCGVALSLPAFAADISVPPTSESSISYAQYKKYGGNGAILALPPGEFEIRRDKAHIVPGAGLLGGLLTYSTTFIVAGALVMGGVALGKEIEEELSNDDPPANSNNGGGDGGNGDGGGDTGGGGGDCPSALPLTDPRDDDNCIAEVAGEHCPARGEIPNSDKNACIPCAAGMFEASDTEETCRNCPGNRIYDAGNNACTCPAALPHTNPVDRNNCIAEVAGEHCPALGEIPNTAKDGCTSCAAGMFEISNTEETCRNDCPGNQIHDTVRNTCTCPAALPHINPVDRNNCIAEFAGEHCPARNEIPNTAKDGCTSCAAGMFETSDTEETCRNNCPGNQIYNAGNDTCTCPAALPHTNPLDGDDCIAEVAGEHCPARGEIPNTAKDGCTSCAAGMLEDSDMEETCRLPNSDAECLSLNASHIYDSTDNECRLPKNSVECQVIDPKEFFDDSAPDKCAISAAATACGSMVFVQAGGGSCRPAVGDDCRNANREIRDGMIPMVENGILTCVACASEVELGMLAGKQVENADGLSCRSNGIPSDCPVNGEIPRTINGIVQAIDGTSGIAACFICPVNRLETDDELGCRPRTTEETAEFEACKADENHASRRRQFTIPDRIVLHAGGRRVLTSPTTSEFRPAGIVTLTNNTISDLFNAVKSPDSGGSGIVNPSFVYAIRGSITLNGITDAVGNFDNGRNPPDRVRLQLQAGDVVAFAYFVDSENSRTLIPGAGAAGTVTSATPANMRGAQLFRVVDRDGDGVLRLATGETTGDANDGGTRSTLAFTPGSGCENISASQPRFFYYNEDWTATRAYDSGLRTVFPLRGILGGELNNSAKAGSFSFAMDSLKDIRMEYALPEAKTAGILWRGYSGYRRQDGGKTQLYYQKSLAEYAPENAKWKLYAMSQSGRVNSVIYESNSLQGFAAGFYYNGLFRHDDSYHIRIHTAFSAAEVREWKISANVRVGNQKESIYFGLDYSLEADTTTAHLLYRYLL